MKKLITFAIIAIMALCASQTISAQRGYRGFVDAEVGYEWFKDDLNYSRNCQSIGISTTHGYQMGQWFIGGGLTILNCSGSCFIEHKITLPIYAQVRYDHSLVSKNSFFALSKAGYDPIALGPYFCVGGGMRINIDNKIQAMNIGINILIRDEETVEYWEDYHESNNFWGISASFGIEF